MDRGFYEFCELTRLWMHCEQWMYADQNRASVEKDKTVFQAVADNYDEIVLGSRSVKSRAYLSWFNFKGGDQQKPVGSLSGGELNRLALAQVTKAGGNLLLGGSFRKLFSQSTHAGVSFESLQSLN